MKFTPEEKSVIERFLKERKSKAIQIRYDSRRQGSISVSGGLEPLHGYYDEAENVLLQEPSP